METASAHPGVINAADAQSLPDKELARRVLGEVGAAVVIAIDRPSWGPRPRLGPYLAMPPIEPWPPKGPPPLGRLIFYSRPHVTGSQFGLCGADVITVTYEDGEIPRIHAEERYGIVYPLEAWPESWSYDKSGPLCAAATGVKTYFPAPDGEAAYEIARQFGFVARAARGGRPPFAISCSFDRRPCGMIVSVLAKLSVTNIVTAGKVPCPRGVVDWPACYTVTIRSQPSSENANWRLTIVGNFMNRAMSVKSVKAEPIITVY